MARSRLASGGVRLGEAFWKAVVNAVFKGVSGSAFEEFVYTKTAIMATQLTSSGDALQDGYGRLLEPSHVGRIAAQPDRVAFEAKLKDHWPYIPPISPPHVLPVSARALVSLEY